jgi:two-component system, response regulator RegA
VSNRVRSVLIVDDEAHARKAACRSLELGGYSDLQVFCAPDSATAYTIATDEDIQVAIVDYRILEPFDERSKHCVSGIDVIRCLKAICPSLTAVLWSGYLTHDVVDDARDAGAAFSKDKLVTTSQIVAQIETGKREAVSAEGTKTLARAEWEHMHRVLADTGNNISEAARRLGVNRSVLQRKLRRLPPREFAARIATKIAP